MDPIFTKLNYREGQSIYVVQPPKIFEVILATLTQGTTVKKQVEPHDEVEFVLVFADRRATVEEMARSISPHLKGDAIFWVAYPKGTSKKYTCDFNRDTSWEIMAPFHLVPVRQISIDADWSALRFRKPEYVTSRKA